MKKILLLSVFVACALAQDIAPGEFTADDLISDNNRIGSGVAAKKGENLDYCYINSQFIQKSQSCGCEIISKDYVATSGRCIYE